MASLWTKLYVYFNGVYSICRHLMLCFSAYADAMIVPTLFATNNISSDAGRYYTHHWNTPTILLTEKPLPLSELQIHGVLFLKYRLFLKNSRCQCILMKMQTIHWKQQIHWKTWKFSRMLWGKPRDFWRGNKKKHIIILSRYGWRSVKKLFLDTSFCSMW